jgi:hypothetical protein
MLVDMQLLLLNRTVVGERPAVVSLVADTDGVDVVRGFCGDFTRRTQGAKTGVTRNRRVRTLTLAVAEAAFVETGANRYLVA